MSSKPKDVAPSNVTTTSVKISWKTPDIIAGNVTYYSICVRKIGILVMDCKVTLVEPTTLSVVIRNLVANTSYGIRVRADNCRRPGNYSKELVIKTLGKYLSLVNQSLIITVCVDMPGITACQLSVCS